MLFSSLFSVAAIASTALAANSAGCNKNPTLRSGVQNINSRQYTLKLPQNYDNKKPYKLIFGFHWLGGSMNDVVNGNSVQPWYGLDTLSQGSAIFVAPNGLNNGWANQGGQDIAFVDAIIKQVEADLCVDQSQRFATGFSYGAGMSYSIACSRAKQFRAVAPIAGGLISGCDGGNDPIAYLGIHGVSDNVLPISGGIDLAQRFVKNNGCRAKQIQTVPAGSGRSVRTDFEGCSQPVSFIAWDGGHSGAPFGTGNSLAPKATWDFFTALRSNSAANVVSNETEAVEQTGSEEVEAAPVAEAPAAEAPASGAPAGNPWWGQANGQWKPWTA